MSAVLSLVFFLSGAAALLFEGLWLRRAGLMFGSSVWASSIVLAAFMAGLAVGNALALRWAAGVTRPLRLYALLELCVGGAGTLVVLATPALTLAVSPLFRSLGDTAGLINLVRLAIAFVLVLLPTAAMGFTLPLLTRTLSRGNHDFGRVLGRLYGWNTLGGMLGAVAGELWLIAPLGVRGTALFAAGLSSSAAVLAWSLSRQRGPQAEVETSNSRPGHGQKWLGPRSLRLLAAAFLAGASLLALEVIWFRFLQLFLFGTTLTFAFMLAIILLGVAGGSLAASWWLRQAPPGLPSLPAVSGAAAIATTLTYAFFSPWYRGAAFFISQPDATLVLSLRLMLATSLASGALFTLQGAALRHLLPGSGETAGVLTLANTLGAMVGALVAGFVLLPVLGMERSIFALVVLYAMVAALSGPPVSVDASRSTRRLGLGVWIGSMAAAALCLLLFPHGAMDSRHLPVSLARFQGEGVRVLALREGVNQTTTVLRSEWAGESVAHRLVTNGHSMSGTDFADRRYMKMFVNWALAVNPRIRHALLISYGLGSTAKALTDTHALTSIHIADISREILDMASVVFPPGKSPLRDPRVSVHLEDGRFLLQTTTHSFDLITGEPPPPKGAGIVNLYSREYFQLLHDRLNDGGVATYWLPVEELDEDDARAVVSAFCVAFVDCSLWTGAGPHWMLAGTRGLRQRAPEEAFVAQWRDDVVGPELIRLGMEQPEQLGATFLADAEQLAPWIAGISPLDDDHPQRLSPGRPHSERQDFIEHWMETGGAARRFERSKLVQELWPPGLRARSRDLFATQRVINDVTFVPRRWPGLEALRDLLNESTLRTLPLLVAGTSPDLQEISQRAWGRGDRSPALEASVAIGALVRRDYSAAAEHFASAAAASGPEAITARLYQAFALLMAEKTGEARAALAAIGSAPAASPEQRQGLLWLGAMLAD
jgi:spermidine synthase